MTLIIICSNLTGKKLSQQEKVSLISNTGKLYPEVAILPVLAGVTSYYGSVKSSAQKSLETIQASIGELLTDTLNKKQYAVGLKQSCVPVCQSICPHSAGYGI